MRLSFPIPERLVRACACVCVIRVLRRFERADALFPFDILSHGFHLMWNNITTFYCERAIAGGTLRETEKDRISRHRREKKKKKKKTHSLISQRETTDTRVYWSVHAWLVGGLKRHVDSKKSNFVITFSRFLSRALFAVL